ncbi:malate synthase A (plasmid) [Deinococcus taeanensis]|uniref:aldolase/citrate lyase family protein n=1 Tax=Deinococcus taeanensis TaxID=2737050 RepID=UPI001CDCC209|nr:aldolase/citrate lyase family protein [Deinococcus taeanensis]UBV44974.1 malate synthase A [Deinococcus taeanensis]
MLPPSARPLAWALHEALAPHWAALDRAAPQGLASSPIAALPAYHAASVPPDLKPGRAELIVEASDLPALRAALRCGADAVVIDFDDTFAPTPANLQAAYGALPEVLNAAVPLLARPRALYALEPAVTQGGQPARAALCDLAALLTARPGRVPHLYLPKLETRAQARAWAAALSAAETHLGLPGGSLRVCLQIETLPGLLVADELLFDLRRWAFGLNAGRWDYVFSLVKSTGAGRAAPIPPRSALGMDVDAMQAYAQALVQVCRARGAQAVGGTAAVAPDPAAPQAALDAVRADKRREAAQGFAGAWAGRPDLLDAVRAGLAQGGPGSPGAAPVTPQRLLNLPDPGPLDPREVADTAALALDVFQAWFAGRGVVTRAGRIEDTATAELARALLWQWVRVQAPLAGGDRLDRAAYLTLRRTLRPDDAPEAALLDHLVLSAAAPAYFPREAQRLALTPRLTSPAERTLHDPES